jgi:hypothetical protein
MQVELPVERWKRKGQDMGHICFQPNTKFEKKENKYNLQQFKSIIQNKIQFVQQENTRKQKNKLKKQLLCPISTLWQPLMPP